MRFTKLDNKTHIRGLLCEVKRGNTVQYNSVQYSTIQYSTIQYSTIQIQYNTIQYNTNTVQ